MKENLLGENKRKIYYHLEDENNNKYFKKQFKSESNTERLKNEIKVLNEFSNYNCFPKVINYSLEEKYIVFDFIEGNNLNNSLFNIKNTIEIVSKIINILEVIHSKGYIFGDLKPSNVIISDKLTLVDYESTTKIGEPLNYASGIYCSIYQKEDNKAIYGFDFYSLGLLIISLLEGEKVLKNYVENDRLYNLDNNPSMFLLPKELQNILKKLLAYNPEDNYNDIKDLKRDINNVKKIINEKHNIFDKN